MRTGRDPIEDDFLEALGRLMTGTPINERLAKRAAAGTLRVSLASVAEEAGRSRTLIALEKCRFPDARRIVLEAIGRKAGTAPVRDQLGALRAELRDNKDALAKLATRHGETLQFALKQKAEVERLKGILARKEHKTSLGAERALVLPVSRPDVDNVIMMTGDGASSDKAGR